MSFKSVTITLVVLAGLILTQSAALADQVVLHVTGSPTGYNMGGVFSSPYAFTVDGVPGFLLVCDDFATDINFGDTWLANRMDFAAGPLVAGGPQKFNTVSNGDGTNTVVFPDGTSAHYTIQQQYDAVAWLVASLLMTSPISSDQAGFYSFAVWQIFDSQAYLSLTPPQRAAVTSDMHAAFAANAMPEPGSVFIYTAINSGIPGYIFPSQEFIGIVPSNTTLVFPTPDATSTLSLLALSLLILVGAFLSIRYRNRRHPLPATVACQRR